MTDTVVPAQTTAATPLDAAEAYLAAWNAHDGGAVAALVGGSYVDPTLPAPISGAELAANVEQLCAAFPDLRFETEGVYVAGGVVTTQWRMRGTNTGAPVGAAPAATGAEIDLPGIDVITTTGGRIDTVVGYFDRAAFIEQLGFQAIIGPKDEWPVSAGLGIRLDLGNTATPGAISLTWIELSDPQELAELSDRTREILMGLAGEPSFIGFQSTSVGNRNLTLTAWTSPEAAEAALARNPAHREAMGRVMQGGFGGQGFTSIWQPYRLNPQYVRCGTCREYVAIPTGDTAITCSCGAELAVVPYL
jgi:steroid delta-isomerase-like uncharacterized protein